MFEVLTSSQLAIAIQVALVAVAALLLTAAELRVISAPAPRAMRYGVAWLVCTAILAALAIYLDTMVGIIATGDRVLSAVGAGVLCAVGLSAGAWLTRRSAWRSRPRPLAILVLAGFQALLALLALSLR